MAKHAVLSASGAYRWLACPGSIRMCEGIPSVSSVYAQEGTAAHNVADKCFRMGWDAKQLLGGIEMVEGKPYDVTQEMVDAVQVYLDTVRADYAAAGADASLLWEKKFKLRIREGMYGRNDSLVGQPFGLLRVYDFKYGAGVIVDANDNPQLMYYGLGAAENETYDEVELVIVQPRAQHPDGPVRRCRMPITELQTWAKEVLLPGAAATDDPNAPLITGEHCRFCNALAICPKQKETALAVAKTVFDEMPVAPIAPEGLSMADLRQILNVADLLETWLDACRKHVKNLLETGKTTPEECGYKLVPGRGSRNWKDEKDAEAWLTMLLDDDAYTPRKLISPAQAEAILKGAENKRAIATMVETKAGGKSMVSASDNRPAMQPAIAAFGEVTDI